MAIAFINSLLTMFSKISQVGFQKLAFVLLSKLDFVPPLAAFLPDVYDRKGQAESV